MKSNKQNFIKIVEDFIEQFVEGKITEKDLKSNIVEQIKSIVKEKEVSRQ